MLFIPLVGFAGRLLHPFFYRICAENEHRVSLVGFIGCIAFTIPLFLDAVTPLIAAICLSVVYLYLASHGLEGEGAQRWRWLL